MQPSVEVTNINGRDALMTVMSIKEGTVDTTTDQLGREEEDFGSGPWDTEW